MKTVHCFLLGIFLAATAAAQPIYETQDKDGPVFSDLPSQGRDVPSPGATELALPPINVSDPPPAAPPAESAPAPTAAPYQSLSISQRMGTTPSEYRKRSLSSVDCEALPEGAEEHSESDHGV